MQYRNNKKGEPISILGYGCMRFTRKGNKIDIDKAQAEVKAAIDGGVNYFDTAYLYPGNEVAVGEIMKRLGCREQVNIATKLPQYIVKSAGAIDKFFDEELKRLQTDYIDYYLMHMLTDVAAWEKLKRLGIEDWIAKKKEKGIIRNIGFSFHGDTQKFLEILDAYDWDFCQIQYNYMDTEEQAGDRGYALTEELGVPLVIMEPVKGGSLAKLPEEVEKTYRALKPDASTASFALRWVGSHPNVKVVLSGMSSEEQVRDNVHTFTDFEPLSEEEQACIKEAVKTLRARVKNGCTGCRYCMPCPFGVNIPGTFRFWNTYHMYQNYWAVNWGWENMKAEEKPEACKKCGKCEQACPQKIAIREDLARAQADLDNPQWKP